MKTKVNKVQPGGGQKGYLNNKGIAISGIMYLILFISLLLIVGTLKTLQNRKTIMDKLKSDTVNALEIKNYETLITAVNGLTTKVDTLETEKNLLYDTIDDLNNEISSLKEATKDTGWIDLSSYLSSGISVYSASQKIEYRKIGKFVEIRGQLKNTADIGSASNQVFSAVNLLEELPDEIKPSYSVVALQQGSTTAQWLLTISTAGSITISRYSVVNSGGTTWSTNGYNYVPSGSWLTIHVVYTID